jgi:hypothetical protein
MRKHWLKVLELRHSDLVSTPNENTMMKQIEVHGERVEVYSQDEGRTWSSNRQSIVAYGQRKEMLRLELQNSFAQIDEIRDLDADNVGKLNTLKTLATPKPKSPEHSNVVEVQPTRLGTGISAGRVVTSDHAPGADQWGDPVGGLIHPGLHREGHTPGHRTRPAHLIT